MTDRYTQALARLLAAVVLELDAARDNRPGAEWPALIGAWEATKSARPWNRQALRDIERQVEERE